MSRRLRVVDVMQADFRQMTAVHFFELCEQPGKEDIPGLLDEMLILRKVILEKKQEMENKASEFAELVQHLYRLERTLAEKGIIGFDEVTSLT